MHDRILERTVIALERYVTAINDSRPDASGTCEAPVPWLRYPERFSRSEIPRLISQTRNVLQARVMFAREAPSWAQPLPTEDELHPLAQARGAMCLLGHYGYSLMMMSYDCEGHPSFHTYGCGVMAHPRAPDHVRDDPELQAEFPAKELPGLCGRLVWFGESLPPRVRAELLSR